MAFVKWNSIFNTLGQGGWVSIFSFPFAGSGLPGEPVPPAFPPSATTILARDIRILNMVAVATAPPGLGNSFFFKYKENTNVDLTPPIAISDSNTTANFTVNALIPTPTESYMTFWENGNPSASVHIVTACEDPNDPSISYYAMGGTDPLSNMGSVVDAGTDFFDMVGTLTGAAETFAQTPWPVTGNFKNFYVQWSSLAQGATVSLVLRKNGADTPLIFNLVGQTHFPQFSGDPFINPTQSLTDLNSTIPVSAGDLMDWSVTLTSGTNFNNAMALFISYGFSAV
jgi:hypothetical protein